MFPWMILPTTRLQTWDYVLFHHQFRRYVKHLLKCEICGIRTTITIVLEIISHE